MYRKNLFIFFIFLLGFILNVISVQIVSSSFKELQGALGASIEQVSYVMSASLIAEVIIIPFSVSCLNFNADILLEHKL